jgi:hypothetical protein
VTTALLLLLKLGLTASHAGQGRAGQSQRPLNCSVTVGASFTYLKIVVLPEKVTNCNNELYNVVCEDVILCFLAKLVVGTCMSWFLNIRVLYIT